MKVLVTGGLGFIGSETVVSLIENKFDVVIIDNLFNSNKSVLTSIKKITGVQPKFYEFDVRDSKKLEKVFKKEKFDAIIHFAGYKAVAESVEKPLMYYENNIGTTIELLKCMEKFAVKNFVFSSSATVYGDPKKVPVRETDPIQSATSPYGETKIINEQLLMNAARIHKDWNVALLRYFNPIGAHPSGLLGEDPNGIPNNLFPYISKVAFGKLPFLNITGNDYKTKDGTGVRDYIHVLDLAYGHVLALKKFNKKTGLVIYNLGTSKGSSVLDVVHAYEKANNIKIKYKFKARRPGDVAVNYANCDKAKKELGFTCKYTILDACKHDYLFRKNQDK